ncbi:hypothetical protein [Algihabitans albus]|uniref:hypothetical protein n=1 Tax=Algihabitans albus TaxID=2164067 RepID=UPI000E5D1419|nr:hypothetical protein [Algihabitans albus]
MTWLSLLRLVLSVAEGLLSLLRERRLIEAGEAQAIAAGLEASRDALEDVRRARRDPALRQRLRERWTRDG